MDAGEDSLIAKRQEQDRQIDENKRTFEAVVERARPLLTIAWRHDQPRIRRAPALGPAQTPAGRPAAMRRQPFETLRRCRVATVSGDAHCAHRRAAGHARALAHLLAAGSRQITLASPKDRVVRTSFMDT